MTLVSTSSVTELHPNLRATDAEYQSYSECSQDLWAEQIPTSTRTLKSSLLPTDAMLDVRYSDA